jgi:hypothetical protein
VKYRVRGFKRMNLRISLSRKSIGAGLLAGFLSVAAHSFAASPAPFSGQIYGRVQNSAGVSQMGAAVLLYNRYDELVRKSLTNEEGQFAFGSLAADLYTIRVVLASFMPAERRNIAVVPNSENRLEIHLASVLSTVEIRPPTANRGTLMTDDWKWVLRSSQSTRPILRMLPGESGTQVNTGSHDATTAAFSNTTGVVKLSAGEGQSLARGLQQDLGTAFALATSLAGSGRVQVSGNLGAGANVAAPAAAFRTSYSRDSEGGFSPEVILTMRQMLLAPREGSGITIGTGGAPVLRTMSLAFIDQADIADSVHLDYGFDMQSISYLDRLNYASPFARATYDAGNQGRVRAAFSSGAPPVEMLVRDEEKSGSFDQQLAALAQMPRISLLGSRVTVERAQNYEVGYERVEGSRTYSLAAYQESVSNAALMFSGSAGMLPAADLLPDLSSSSSIYNVGSYRRTGITASVRQDIGNWFEVTVAAGRTGALLAAQDSPRYANNSGDLRASLRLEQRPWVTVRLSGRVPGAGTKITANYGWTDFGALMPIHLYLTQQQLQDIGWNLYLRQPVPLFTSMPWRMEVSAEVRNLLAQGYMPLGSGNATGVITNSPRALRGGLNFIF